MSSQKLPTVQFIILLVSYYRAPLIAISTTTTRFILIIVFLVITFTYLKIRISCGAATKCCNKLTLQLNGFMHQISFIDRIKKKTLKYMPLFFSKKIFPLMPHAFLIIGLLKEGILLSSVIFFFYRNQYSKWLKYSC